MPSPLPTTTLTLNDTAVSGFLYSPSNGYNSQPGPVTVGAPIPGGWGPVGVASVLLDAGTNYYSGSAAHISVRLSNSGGLLLGTGAVSATFPNPYGGASFIGLRDTGIAWDINDGATPPIMGISTVWYQITLDGDAAQVGPSGVQINLLIARYPRRVTQII